MAPLRSPGFWWHAMALDAGFNRKLPNGDIVFVSPEPYRSTKEALTYQTTPFRVIVAESIEYLFAFLHCLYRNHSVFDGKQRDSWSTSTTTHKPCTATIFKNMLAAIVTRRRAQDRRRYHSSTAIGACLKAHNGKMFEVHRCHAPQMGGYTSICALLHGGTEGGTRLRCNICNRFQWRHEAL